MHKNLLSRVFLILIFLLMPSFVLANVVINEIAWMGTADSQYEEWLELYNNGQESISLNGWNINKGDGTTNLFALSGEIGAGKYFLVCRTTPSITNPLAGICDLNGGFGGSGLNNSTENIYLKDATQNIIDSVEASSGWPAGDSSTKQTMQWNGTSWITGDPTPGLINQTSEDDDSEEGDSSVDTNNSSSTQSVSTKESPSKEEDKSLKKKVYSTMLLNLEAPSKIVAGSPAHFKAEALDFDRSIIFKGHYAWNMGDGTIKDWAVGYKKTHDGFDHVYQYPGTYSVDVKYYDTLLQDVPAKLEKRFVVEVIDSALAISKVYSDSSVEIENTSNIDVDMSDWQLRDYYGGIFIFPKDSFIQKGKKIVVNEDLSRLRAVAGVYLFTPTNTLISTSEKTGNNYNTKKIAEKHTTKNETENKDSPNNGLVLGAEDFKSNIKESTFENIHEKTSPTFNMWILVFIALVAIVTFAIFFLKKEETKNEEEYELIDE